MRGICVAAAAFTVVVCELPAVEAPATLLTIVQRDRFRAHLHGAPASLTSDGRLIAFASYAPLSPIDADSLADIYVLDRATGQLTLESPDAAEITADCLYPRISGDGRFLVYESASPGGSDQPFGEVLFRDRSSGAMKRISRGPAGTVANGWSANAAISDDGRIVVFESAATNLTSSPDPNDQRPDVYLADVVNDQVRRVPLAGELVGRVDGSSFSPTVSGDGRYVAFVSSVALAPPRDDRVDAAAVAATRDIRQIYLHDTQVNITSRVGVPTGANAPNAWSARPTISRDGAYIAFVSAATNLVAGDQNRSPDVFLYDTRTGAITLVSRNGSGRPANGTSGSPAVSSDGRFVAFQSDATDLVCGRRCPNPPADINLLPDVFLFDRVTGAIEWVSTGGGAGAWLEESVAPALDGTGRILAFTSRHPTGARDTAHDFDLFVRVPTDQD